MNIVKTKSFVKIFIISLSIVVTVFVFYSIYLSIYDNKNDVIKFITSFGILSPLFFIILQIFQVIFPIIPGGMYAFSSVLLFGPFYGFIYNYIGICIGSLLAFYLAKKYGLKIVRKFVSETTIYKYLPYINNNKFNIFFIISILLPVFPDDVICFIAGLSQMKFKSCLQIILICKPFTLILYSFGVNLL